MRRTLQLAHGFRCQWEAAQGCHVLLYPEGMIRLNRSAGEILIRCDGLRPVDQIVSELEQAFAATNLRGDIEAFVALALEKGWVQASPVDTGALS